MLSGWRIREGQERGEIASQDNNPGSFKPGVTSEDTRKTLSEIGITHDQSSTFKPSANLPLDISQADAQRMGEAVIMAKARVGELLEPLADPTASRRGIRQIPQGVSYKTSHQAQTIAKANLLGYFVAGFALFCRLWQHFHKRSAWGRLPVCLPLPCFSPSMSFISVLQIWKEFQFCSSWFASSRCCTKAA
jgi:hypothetical protein